MTWVGDVQFASVFGTVGLAIGTTLALLLRRRHPLRNLLALGILALWPVIVTHSYDGTGCYLSTDGSFALMLFASLLAGIALPMLAVRPVRLWTRLVIPALTVGPLLFFIGHALRTGFGMKELCWPGYDEWMQHGMSRAQVPVYYPVMWSLSLLLSATALIPYLRRRLANPPAAPA